MGELRAPFPYFGGKSRAADLIWPRFGKVINFVEPFAGSLAVLLACPEIQRPRVETVNDANAFLANFWRATAWDPEAVARWADWPVNETDLHSRHKWLLRMVGLLRARLDRDPSYFDARIAGWWVWGASAWIGSGWCEESRKPTVQIVDLHCAGQGVNALGMREPSTKLPLLIGGSDVSTPQFGKGVHAGGMRAPSRQLPQLGGAPDGGGRHGKGIHGAGMRKPSEKLPDVGARSDSGGAGRGVHSGAARGPSEQLPALNGGGGAGASSARGVHNDRMRRPSEQLPDVGARSEGGGAGRGVQDATSRTRLYDIFAALSARLRHVRVACGDFERILTDAVTHRHGLTAVFLDPPYEGFEGVYGQGEPCAARARAWALEAGKRPDMRVCLAGYEGEHPMPEGWECVAWKAKGGYSNSAKDGDNGNANRERLWFSPACLRPGVDTGQLDWTRGL